MKSRSFITNKWYCGFWALVFGLCCLASIPAQKIAIITPEKNLNTEKIAAQFAERLSTLDADLVANTMRSTAYGNLFNLSIDEAKNLGNAIGCNYFVIVKSENLRRSSFTKPLYFESYAAIYIVSTRTGQLIFWTLKNFEAETAANADEKLFESIESLTKEIESQISDHKKSKIDQISPPDLEELPDENSPEAKNFRSPLPFKRMIPPYKSLANIYGIAATVDATVDLDEKGKITRIEITRWAGYDLDTSVVETIKKMNWRPASRDGKPLPIRVLLRYNFRKLEID